MRQTKINRRNDFKAVCGRRIWAWLLAAACVIGGLAPLQPVHAASGVKQVAPAAAILTSNMGDIAVETLNHLQSNIQSDSINTRQEIGSALCAFSRREEEAVACRRCIWKRMKEKFVIFQRASGTISPFRQGSIALACIFSRQAISL